MNDRWALIVLVTLAAIGASVTALPAAADSGAVDDTAVTATTPADAAGSVTVPTQVSVDRGGIASIPVTLERTQSAYVTIGTVSNSGFRVVLAVEDGNDDGRVTVEANTYNLLDETADNATRVRAANESDSVRVIAQNGLSAGDPLPVTDSGARSYDLRAGTAWDARGGALAGDRDRSVLRVVERSTEGLTVWTAPRSQTFQSLSEFESVRASGLLNRTHHVDDRTAVVAIEASGLDGALRAAAGETSVDRFETLLDEDVVAFGLSPDGAPNPVTVGHVTPDVAGGTVVADPANETVYVMIPPWGRALATDRLVEFRVPEGSPLATGTDQTVGTTLSVSTSADRTDPQPAPDGSMAVENVTVTRGSVATLSVDMGDHERATVRLGSHSAGWERIVRVADGDGDGHVDLHVNTYTAGDWDLHRDSIRAAGPDDEVVELVDQYNTFDRALGAGPDGTYAYTVAVGEAYNASGDRFVGDSGVGTLTVEERSTTGVTMWTASTTHELDSASDVRAAIDYDRLTRNQFVAEGDYAVAEIDATGLSGPITAHNATDGVDMLRALREDGIQFTVEKPGQMFRDDSTVDLAEHRDAVRVVADSESDRLFVLMNTSAFGDLSDGDQRVPTFTITEDSPLASADQDGNVTVEEAFEMAAPWVSFDESSPLVAPGQTVSGTTNLAPGTALTVQVDSEARTPDESHVDTIERTIVGPDGRWSIDVDLSEARWGQSYSVRVVDPDVNASHDGDIVRPTASVSIDRVTADTVTVRRVNLSEGGFLIVKADHPDGPFVGLSHYLEPGVSVDVEIPVSGVSAGDTVYAVAHTDANGNEEYDGDGDDGDLGYETADGSLVSDRGTVAPIRDLDYYRGLTDPTDELSPSAVMTAKGDYLTGAIDLDVVVGVMRAYFFE